jgi:hypothetical protein
MLVRGVRRPLLREYADDSTEDLCVAACHDLRESHPHRVVDEVPSRAVGLATVLDPDAVPVRLVPGPLRPGQVPDERVAVTARNQDPARFVVLAVTNVLEHVPTVTGAMRRRCSGGGAETGQGHHEEGGEDEPSRLAHRSIVDPTSRSCEDLLVAGYGGAFTTGSTDWPALPRGGRGGLGGAACRSGPAGSRRRRPPTADACTARAVAPRPGRSR